MRIQYDFYDIPAEEGNPEYNHEKLLKLAQAEGYSTK